MAALSAIARSGHRAFRFSGAEFDAQLGADERRRNELSSPNGDRGPVAQANPLVGICPRAAEYLRCLLDRQRVDPAIADVWCGVLCHMPKVPGVARFVHTFDGPNLAAWNLGM